MLADESKNWGKKADKKMMVFGLLAETKKAETKALTLDIS